MIARRSLRRFLRRPVDVVVLLVAMLVGGWVTAQLPEHDAPPSDDQVYPPPVRTLRFSHERHSDVGCTTCHGAALTSRRASDSLRPAMTACAGCHDGAHSASSMQQCGTCHVGYDHRADKPIRTAADWRAVRPAPMILPRPQAALRFDHAGHVPRLGGESSCSRCHGAGEPTMPTMQSCGACHDGKTAPASCSTCHPTGANGKLRGARQSIDEPLRPANHGVDFDKRHASVAKSAMSDCMSCHVEEDCASCHDASMAKPFTVHPPNFLTIHAVDARSGAGECTDCHAVQTFCTSCHVRADVMAQAPHDPPPRRTYHPPGWLDASTANNHGVMSRRDITECASCHAESDCVACHAGINPHPPEFGMTCRRLLAANATSCAKCHSDMAGLRALCP